MIQKSRLVMQHYQPLMPTSQFQGISKFQFQKMWMSQFKKILSQNFKKLILRCWSGILDCVNKYGIIMLINVMKSNELTITIVFSNPHCLHTKNPDQKSIVVAFKTLGSNSFPCFLYNRLQLKVSILMLFECLHCKVLLLEVGMKALLQSIVKTFLKYWMWQLHMIKRLLK